MIFKEVKVKKEKKDSSPVNDKPSPEKDKKQPEPKKTEKAEIVNTGIGPGETPDIPEGADADAASG